MNFSRHFTVKKTRLPLPAVKFSCLYIQWVAYMNAVCKECLRIKMCHCNEISCTPRENKGLGNRL